VPQPVERGVLGGQLAGPGTLVVFAEVREDSDDPVADPGRLGGPRGRVQAGLAVLPAADIDQDHVVAGEVRAGRPGDLGPFLLLGDRRHLGWSRMPTSGAAGPRRVILRE
jgi:hypothetical protein